MQLPIRPLAAIPFCLAGALAWAAPPTFSRDVMPILAKRCVGCHQPGEIGPMPLTSYGEVRPWSAAIREAVSSRTMPPWHATSNTAHAFQNDRSLSNDEIATIIAWANSGSPEGEKVAANHPQTERANWKLGKPDVVIQVPGFQVPKTGSLPYSFLIVPLHFEHDTWVRAAEFRIDQRAVIHHMNAFIRPPRSSFLAGFPANQIFVPTVAERGNKRAGEQVFDRREMLLGYEPGYEPQEWLKDGAKLIRAGSDVIFEMHYNPNGKEVTDRSELALYFAQSTPAKRILAIDTLRNLDLAIPAKDADAVSKAHMTLAMPVTLLSVQPHMHMRGKSMEVIATYPDGTVDQLINVPHYDFQWQTTYRYLPLIPLPAHTRLDSIAHFDNSVNNKFNPDANATVHWGDQTTDEMHIAFLELVIDAAANPDSLFAEAPRMIGTPSAATPSTKRF